MRRQLQVMGLGFVLLFVGLTWWTTIPVSAAGVHPEILTPQQMEQAVEIANAFDITLRQDTVPNTLYHLASCSQADPAGPCYFSVSGGMAPSAAQPAATAMTYTCGVNVYNHVGWQVAVLKQNVNVSHLSTGFTADWGHLGGTSAWGLGYSWAMLTGPAPNPTWGTLTGGPAFFTTGGNLAYSVPPNYNYSMFLTSVLTVYAPGGYSCL